MYILTHVKDHSLIIMSLLGVQETRNRAGLEEIMTRGEKFSCCVRTSGELHVLASDRLTIANTVSTSQHCEICYHIRLQQN